MAYSEQVCSRIREILKEQHISFEEKKMFMGCCWMVNDKMLCGTHNDKVKETAILLVRVSNIVVEAALKDPYIEPMTMGGKVSKNYLFIAAPAFRTKAQLSKWLQYCLDYNPEARKSKKG